MENGLFLAKKFLGGLLMPLPVALILLVWALLFLLRRKTRWAGFLCVLLATALLFVASYAPLSNPMIRPLEQQFASYQPGASPVDYVSVLGSGHDSADHWPITSEVTPVGVVRLAEGIRVYRLNPGSKLIFSGYHGDDRASNADKIKQLALALGVPEADVITFTGPRDTAEEAQTIAENFPDAKLALVTSAAHMTRAMGLFHGAGLDPIPAPTNHQGRPVRSPWQFPDAHNLANSRSWLHEQLGIAWAGLRGQIKQAASDIGQTKVAGER